MCTFWTSCSHEYILERPWKWVWVLENPGIWSLQVLESPENSILLSVQTLSLIYLLAWHPPLHIPYISSPNDCLLFAAHAHTIATCFCCSPEIMSSNPSLSLNSLLRTLSCNLMPQIHLTILISALCNSSLPLFVWLQNEYCVWAKCWCHSWSIQKETKPHLFTDLKTISDTVMHLCSSL